jgi:hypothetical protein
MHNITRKAYLIAMALAFASEAHSMDPRLSARLLCACLTRKHLHVIFFVTPHQSIRLSCEFPNLYTNPRIVTTWRKQAVTSWSVHSTVNI